MEKGDLIYIPQDVFLYSRNHRYRTTKPLTGLYLDEKEDNFTMKVLVDGEKMNVRKNHVYLLEENYGIS